MKNITISYEKKTIEITKAFAKKASEYGTISYNELSKVRREFPSFDIVVVTPKTSNANTFKGMDYKFMEEYISKQANADERMEKFNKLREMDLSYGEMKQWFIEEFPVFANCKTRAQWILAA